jgi:mono/diheme cytochrome c family protein
MTMKYGVMILLLSLGMSSIALHAQQSGSKNSLSETEKRGQFLFRQRCDVCHVPGVSGSSTETFGPRLTKEIVLAGEGAARRQIRDGGPLMPGFKYALSTSDIEALIQYLKTVDKPLDSVEYSR